MEYKKTAERKTAVADFCNLLEAICKKFNIRIEKKNNSSQSESAYYTLLKNDKRCKLRISCHESREITVLNSYDFDLNLNKAEDLDTEIQSFVAFLGITPAAERIKPTSL
jgi:hypothetical protein